MKTLILLTGIFFCGLGIAQSISSDRLTDWSLAGLQNEKIYGDTEINILDEGGFSDGSTPNDAVISTIISDHTGDSIIIYFPSGVYYFEDEISLPSNFVLRGDGSSETELKFNLGGSGHCVKVTGSPSTDTVQVENEINKDDYSCIIPSTSPLSPGDWIKIFDEDDAKITSSWSAHRTGQLMQIETRDGDEITFKSPFRRDYVLADNPRIVSVSMRENIGLELLKITREDATSSQTDNIHFRYAVNSWVHCIESYNSNFSHVRFEFANNCEVTGSYFKDGHDYGGGGKAYGVVCQFASGECLIERNIFEHLRHSMLLQAGANGNVYSYNYSFDPYWTGVGLPSNSAGEITLHGNYVYCNLFEGNECDNIVIDDSHGQNGPYNTFLRNRALGYGIVMNTGTVTDSQNFIGNEISNTGTFMGNYILAGIDHYEYGNNQNGTCIPAATETVSTNSFYIDVSPFYYTVYSEWPAIGYPNLLNENIIETRRNYSKEFYTACDNTYEDLNSSELNRSFGVYPNPTAGLLLINGYIESDIIQLYVTDINGSQANFSQTNQYLDISNNSDGVYFINILTKEGEFTSFKVILQH